MSEPQSHRLLQFTADHVWLEQNRETLLKEHPDQWVAVKDKQVIASAPELPDLLSQLSDPAHTSIEFLTREPLEMIL